MSHSTIDDTFSEEGSEISKDGSVSEESNDAPNIDAKPKKGRQARACGECNRKKIKCDKRSPRCSLCTRTGRECFYPKKRRRATRVWQRDYSPQGLLDVIGEDRLDQILDNLNPTILQKALSRHNERAGSFSNPEDLQTDDNSSQPVDQMMASSGVQQSEVDHGSEVNPNIFYEQNETQFTNDVFDQILEPWLPDSFMNEINASKAFQGTLGPLQDMSLFRSQLTGDQEMEMDPNFQFGVLPHADAHAMNNSDRRVDRYSIPIPAAVVDETIKTFFKHVSGWLPLFHRPNFYAKYRVHDPDPKKYQALTLEDCLILNSICALAARLSTSTYFALLPPKGRSEPFLNEATRLFQESMKFESAVQPNLALLQGLILLGWYHQVCGSSGRCGNLIGISCRLAYDLGLNSIDQELLETKGSVQWSSAEEWSNIEERRRAWWLVWELDMFSGTILRRPHTIDKTQINVLLPVNDEAWFSNTPVASVPVLTDPLQVWKTLKDSSNQHDRAWFLVASFIRAFATDLVHRRQTSAPLMSDFQASIACFCLSLPRRFNLSVSSLIFDENTYAATNWIVCTHLIIQSSRASLRLCCRRKFPDKPDIFLEMGSASEDEKLIYRIIRQWDPNFIAQACPLVATTLLGPTAVNAKFACELAADPEDSRPMYLEMFKLVLGKIGAYWELGALILELVQMLEARKPVIELVNSRKNDLDRLPFLIPKGDEPDN